jgi:hypothetical protein
MQNKKNKKWIAKLKVKSNLKIENLREYEFIFETALAHESGDPGVLPKKIDGRKFRDTVPLNAGIFCR